MALSIGAGWKENIYSTYLSYFKIKQYNVIHINKCRANKEHCYEHAIKSKYKRLETFVNA